MSAESDSVSEGPNRVSPSAVFYSGTEEGSAVSSRQVRHAHVELSSEQEIGLQSGYSRAAGFMAVNFHAPDIMSIDIISTELVGGADSSTSDVKGKVHAVQCSGDELKWQRHIAQEVQRVPRCKKHFARFFP